MTDYEKDNQELINSCISIIEAETKPIKRKPVKNAVTTMSIDRKRVELKMARNNDIDNDLKEFAKTL